MTRAPGTRLGPYELIALHGAGGMGEVYRARDTRLDRTVAIKILPRNMSEDAVLRTRLEREARAISAFNHPNICALYDVGVHDGDSYLVMEFLDGESLAQRLSRGPLPVDLVVRIGTEIAGALERAHKQGIVHRDLKPGNVILTKGGAKLLDFGLAKPAAPFAHGMAVTTPAGRAHPSHAAHGSHPSHPSQLTSEGTILGTLQYMAPEQLEGKQVDARTDVFALGAVLYEMATGQRAFTGSSQASLIAAVLEREPPPMLTIRPLAPPALERIVRTCLAKDPDERWQSAHDVRTQLRWLAEATSPVTADMPAVPPPRRLRERWLWAGAVLALATALALVLAVRPRSMPVAAKTLRVSIVPPTGITATGPLAIAPDGLSLAFVGFGADGVARLWVRALDSPAARELAGTEDASLPFWSPDGKSLGFFAQRQLKRIEVGGGPPQRLADISDSRGGTWAPDGTIVYAPNPGDGLYWIPSDGGTPAQLTRLDSAHGESSHRWPNLLPGAKHVLYLTLGQGRERYTVRAAALGSGELRSVVPAESGAVYAAPGNLLFVRGDTLLAQRFDPHKLTLSGQPLPVAENVWRDPDLDGLRAFSAAMDGAAGTIAYREGGGETTRPTWFDRAGNQRDGFGAPGYSSVIALSPDARVLARSLTERGATIAAIWLVDLAAKTSSRLTFNSWNDIYPVWSPDGRSVAFASDRTGNYDLFEKPIGGSGVETSLLTSEQWEFPEDWSRDGRTLLFTRRDPTTRGDIWALDLASRGQRMILATDADELQPRMSPDGRWLAYTSDVSGRNEIYVQNLPPSAGKWQVSAAGGFQPQWRRDGKELYYLAPDLRLMAVSVETRDDAFAHGEPRALFATRARRSNLRGTSAYSPSPDGQRFLIDSTVEADVSAPIHLVLGGSH